MVKIVVSGGLSDHDRLLRMRILGDLRVGFLLLVNVWF